MIELRWKKTISNHPNAVMIGDADPRYAEFVVLQYRQEKPGLMVQGMPVLGETTDWQDVEISDD